jgi:anti-sigma B factor antagonist
MLNINNMTAENGEKIIFLEGELDTISAQTLEEKVDELLSDTDKVVVDLEKLEYITSAGLRVLLEMKSTMEERGSMHIVHVSEDLREIFDVTGLAEIFAIE